MDIDRTDPFAQTMAGAAARRRSRRDFLRATAAGSAALAAAAAFGRAGALAAPVSAPEPGGPPAGPRPQPETVLANGAELAYVERGQGDPVVLVHGSLNDVRSWGAQLGPFAERHRTVAYSRRFHWPGVGAETAAGYDATVHAADLAALIEARRLAPAHIVGASYGALVALAMAAARPDLVRTLVLAEPPLLPWLVDVEDGPAILAAFADQTWEPARRAFAHDDAEEGVRLFLDGAVGPGAFDRLPPPVRAMMLDNAPAMGLETRTPPGDYFSAFARTDSQGILAPTLLLTGEFSPPPFLRVTDELEAHLPHVERAVVPGASHALHAMNPETYTDAVLAFTAQH